MSIIFYKYLLIKEVFTSELREVNIGKFTCRGCGFECSQEWVVELGWLTLGF